MSISRGHTPRSASVMVAKLALLVASLLTLGATPAGGSGASEVFVNCETFGHHRFAYDASVHPSTCRLQGLPISGATEMNLSNLRWSGWGSTIAAATGFLHARHGEEVEGTTVYAILPVKIILSRVRTGCDGRHFYTSVSVNEGARLLSDGCAAAAE